MRSKGAASGILFFVIPAIVIAVILFAAIISKLMGDQINTQINEKMREYLERTNLAIHWEFTKNADVATGLAKYAESNSSSNVKNDGMRDFLIKMLQSNNNTLGGGIWYEPFAYNAAEKYYGPYAHLSKGKMVYEADYASQVDYLEEDWYHNGRRSKGEPVWSGVYFDPVADAMMITATVPFFGHDGAMKGVTTADMGMNDIQAIMDGLSKDIDVSVNNLSIGKTSRAFIVSGNGEYITHFDGSRKLTYSSASEQDRALVTFGREILRSGTGISTVKTSGGSIRAFYKTIPETGWILVIIIENSEIFSAILWLILSSAALPVAGLLIVALCISLSVGYMWMSSRKY